MTRELLMDAMAYLPDQMLEQTGRIRTRKARLRPLTTLVAAACLCLLVTAYAFMVAPASKADDAAGNLNAPENGSPLEDVVVTDNSTAKPLQATVEKLEEDTLTVRLTAGAVRTMSLETLEDLPELKPGDVILIYLREPDDSTGVLYPEKILLKEE